MTEDQKPKKVMPKGGRKGGSVFPRVSLADSVKSAKKLVSKTHTGPQEQAAIFAVVGAVSGKGEVRISALKQYGFLVGDKATRFSASELAKQVNAAPEDELQPFLREAALKPQIFSKMFEVFHGDEVTRGKLKQKAAELNVHPDATDDCVEIYVSAMISAGLATLNGEKVQHLSQAEIERSTVATLVVNGKTDHVKEQVTGTESESETEVETGDSVDPGAPPNDETGTGSGRIAPRAVFQVNVSLDSTLDIEKLEKQLALLKRYGAI